jgi:hypothetical protein
MGCLVQVLSLALGANELGLLQIIFMCGLFSNAQGRILAMLLRRGMGWKRIVADRLFP